VLVTAKADYAVRAVVELAAADAGGCLSAESIAARQNIPRPFLIKILQQLRMAGLTETIRGAEGGHRLARAAAEISFGDVMRAVDGSLGDMYGTIPQHLAPQGAAAPVAGVWAELHRRVGDLLENVSIADVLARAVPPNEIDRDRISMVSGAPPGA
jgi:Rrf2 family protein